ncbi:U-box domain-containing protein 4-like [Zingiber officinale]|uniref:U-box domain-containing protein 4-like n=1 Tax=Zingiber officinale TaxID=94328 RepID=UPI001C4D9E8E|nr:U-box domain-containing protein 4-like [Zingiber officinale]
MEKMQNFMTAFSSSSPSCVASITRVVPPLVELVGECGGVTAKKALVVLGSLATLLKGREAVVATGGITVLMEATKTGPTTGREFAVHVLLQLATESPHIQGLLVGEGAIPPLVAMSQSVGIASQAVMLLGYLRELQY